MIRSHVMFMSALTVAGAASVTLADFQDGQSISITGHTGPQFSGQIMWGTDAGQGLHNLGGSSVFWDSVFGDPAAGQLTIGVSSTVINSNSLTLYVDFSNFGPTDFDTLTIDVPNLKQDGSIISVIASLGTVSVNADGNGFHWEGSGGMQPPNVVFEITQTPTPGAAALLALGGAASLRRRRV
jgi:MYXO-CTERM domain-containing protein